MNLANLWIAIRSRLTGDSSLTALVSGIFNSVVPPGTSMPYVVFQVASSVQTDTFTSDVVEHFIRFSVLVPTNTNNLNGLQRAASIIDRIYGNANDATSRVPQYGLHRHALVVTNWKASVVVHVDSTEQHTEEHYHFIETFKVITSKVCQDPIN